MSTSTRNTPRPGAALHRAIQALTATRPLSPEQAPVLLDALASWLRISLRGLTAALA